MSQKANHREIIKYCQMNENKQTKYQNLWDVAKIVHKEKFVIVKANIRK